MKPGIPKWLKWEFWPYHIFYLPVSLLVMVHAIRARSLAYLTLANPGMRLGGFTDYSKYHILNQLDRRYVPLTILLDELPATETVLLLMQQSGIQFPIILKPDQGERGWKVEKIHNETALSKYLADAPPRLILQEYVDLPEEYGIMYYKYPEDKSGNISSVMKRKFLTVTGDGKSTLLELFQKDERCRYHLKRLLIKFNNELNEVLPVNEMKMLEEIGNHNRGTTFISAQHLINAELVKVFDEASSSLNEFYFGRYDVRTASYEDMLKGNFKAIEVNGANSEPAHIYDPHMNLLKAYRSLFSHWIIMFRISMQNKRRGFHPAPAREFITTIRSHLKKKKEHPNAI